MRILLIAPLVFCFACAQALPKPAGPEPRFPGEDRLGNIRQLTFGGTNAEAYWSFGGDELSFQHKGRWTYSVPGDPAEGPACDQIYAMRVSKSGDVSRLRRISNGFGRTTCAFFLPRDHRILYSSTFRADSACPAAPDRSRGYVWPTYPTYHFYTSRADGGGDPIAAEPGAPRAYNAEATVCHDGTVIFTSTRDGDLELYTGKLDSLGTISSVTRITNTPGYDGGAVFSPDCRQIAWRASRPRPGAELAEYRELLAQHLVKPGRLELWTAQVDGKQAHRVTDLGAASFAPVFTPDGKHLVFSANLRDSKSAAFDLYEIRLDGTELAQLTHSGTFDAFPMFSPDGQRLAFASNRNGHEPHETNIFVADWRPRPAPALRLARTAADRVLQLVEELARPEYEGRGAGTAGAARAEDRVARLFAEVGLHPPGEVLPRLGGTDFFRNVDYTVGKKPVRGRNVVGAWGHGCGAGKPLVVLGAHLDHLGMGGADSLEPSTHGLHPGADDNASGVAALLEVARLLIENQKEAPGCLLFAAFTGEETGIAGSSELAKALTAAGIHPRAMLNLDMVGRLRDDTLLVFGTDSAKDWAPLVEKACAAEGLRCPGGGDGYGPSDHMAFFVEKVPVLHFFTGPHLDYHRTTDTADKLNATGAIQTARTVAALARAAGSARLIYQKGSPHALMGQLKGGSRAYLGTIPDYSTLVSPHGPGGGGEAEGGVRLSGTRAGSPADRAGVREGDVLVGIARGAAEERIHTLEEFTAVLMKLNPGDAVVLVVKRGTERLRLSATVGERS